MFILRNADGKYYSDGCFLQECKEHAQQLSWGRAVNVMRSEERRLRGLYGDRDENAIVIERV